MRLVTVARYFGDTWRSRLFNPQDCSVYHRKWYRHSLLLPVTKLLKFISLLKQTISFGLICNTWQNGTWIYIYKNFRLTTLGIHTLLFVISSKIVHEVSYPKTFSSPRCAYVHISLYFTTFFSQFQNTYTHEIFDFWGLGRKHQFSWCGWFRRVKANKN